MYKDVICFGCGSCDTYDLRNSKRRYKGEGYDFELDIKEAYCKKCGEKIVVEELEEEIAEQANIKIRQSKKIITKEEINNIIKKYNVSQKFLSRMLGWGEITLTRYVSGGYTPNQSNSDKLKELTSPYRVQTLLDNCNEELKSEPSYSKMLKNVEIEIIDLEKKRGKLYAIMNWFLAYSSEDNPITHLALQKLLYFSQGWNKAINGEWLFKEECEAWAHGAVYHEVYNEFRQYKYASLPMISKSIINKSDINEKELEVLTNVKKIYFDIYNAKTLENICHKEEPYMIARKDCKEGERCEKIIKKHDIEKYYSNIAKEYNVSINNMQGIKTYLNKLLA